MIKSLLLIFISTNIWAHHHIESTTPTNNTGVISSLRVFKKVNKINYLAEFTYINVENQSNYTTFEVGGKYRFLKNLKVGAYYSRHLVDGNDANVGILELSPRFLLNFLPGERWVSELRVRYVKNFTRSETTLQVRPGLTYFWFKNGAPFINLFTQYESYRSLDYGAKATYAHWFYLGGLYHFSKKLKFAPFFTYVIDKTGWRYQIKHKSKIVGVNVLLYL
jgi:hypothetical protein